MSLKHMIDVKNAATLDKDQIQARNNELFPFLKRTLIPCKKKTLLLPAENLHEFLIITKKIHPELSHNFISQFPQKTIEKIFLIDAEKEELLKTSDELVIRSEDINFHKYDTRHRLLFNTDNHNSKHFLSRAEFYDLDRLTLVDRKNRYHGYKERKSYSNNSNGNNSLPKWMNIAYDIYFIVYNHSKSVIFHKPVDPIALNCPDYYSVIKNPIDLETMKFKLQLMIYNNLQELIKDMNTMFNNCIFYNGKEHKLVKNCFAVQKRFQKYMEKLKSERKIEQDIDLNSAF